MIKSTQLTEFCTLHHDTDGHGRIWAAFGANGVRDGLYMMARDAQGIVDMMTTIKLPTHARHAVDTVGKERIEKILRGVA